MELNNLGILNSLSSIINESEKNSDYFIAKYILENINALSETTVNEITEEVFVSRSAIRRFCNRVGYDNFGILKESLNAIIFPSNMHLREFEDFDKYQDKLTIEIQAMINHMNKNIREDIINQLAVKLYDNNNISLISANNTSANVQKIQQELFYGNKIIKLVDNYFEKDENELYINDDQLVIVVSISGYFAKELCGIINDIKGEKILITANHDLELARPYNQTILISKYDIVNDEIGVYGKYGISYFFDLLSQHYLYKYKE